LYPAVRLEITYSLFAIGVSLVMLNPIAQSFTSNLSSNSDTCTLLFN